MVTYFIQGESTGHIKIGRTSNGIETRLRALQSCSAEQLRLVGIIEDDVEHELHSRFHKQRLHGEWFRVDRHLRTFMNCDPRIVREPGRLLASCDQPNRGPLFEDVGVSAQSVENPVALSLFDRRLALGAAEVALQLGVTANTVEGLHRSGALRGVTIGSHLRWHPQDVRDFVDSLRSERDGS